MHLRKHLLYICAGIIVLGLVYFFALSDIFHPKQIASYENFTDISEEYDAALSREYCYYKSWTSSFKST